MPPADPGSSFSNNDISYAVRGLNSKTHLCFKISIIIKTLCLSYKYVCRTSPGFRFGNRHRTVGGLTEGELGLGKLRKPSRTHAAVAARTDRNP